MKNIDSDMGNGTQRTKDSASPKSAKKKSPGRPEGQSGYREAIMQAAQTCFSEYGYAGTSLRMVAEAAGVTTALISYYFGSKFQLYEEIYMHQASTIANARLEALNALQARRKRLKPAEIFEAFIRPHQEMRRTAEGRGFLRFQWSVDTEPKELSYRLRKNAYDTSTHAYAAALQKARPDLSLRACYAQLAILIGTAMYASSARHRLDELVSGLEVDAGADLIIEELISVISKGSR
jgi:AcrR family transcriptional regulator